MTVEERIAEKVLDVYNCMTALAEAQCVLSKRLYEEGVADALSFPRERLIPLYLEECASTTFRSVPDAIEGEPIVDFKKLRKAAEERAKAMMPKMFKES